MDSQEIENLQPSPTTRLDGPSSNHPIDWSKLAKFVDDLKGESKGPFSGEDAGVKIIEPLEKAQSEGSSDAYCRARIELVSLAINDLTKSNRYYRRWKFIFSSLKDIHNSSLDAYRHDSDRVPRIKSLVEKVLAHRDLIESRNLWRRLDGFIDLLDTDCIEVDTDDCKSIMWHLIYPRLATHPNLVLDKRATRGQYNRPGYCDDYSCYCQCCQLKNYFIRRATNSIHRRHKSISQGSMEVAVARLLEESDGSKLDQNMSFLCFLLRATRDEGDWKSINQVFARITQSDRKEIKSRCCCLLAIVVERNGHFLEALAEHLDWLVRIEDDPSLEVREQNRRAWQSIARTRVIGPHGFKAVRAMVDRYQLKLRGRSESIISESDEDSDEESDDECTQLQVMRHLMFLIMPRPPIDNPDPFSATDLLIDDLRKLVEKKGCPRWLARFFRSANQSHGGLNRGFDDQFEVASYWANFCWAGWRLVKEISKDQLKKLEFIKFLFWPAFYGPYPPDRYANLCELMLDMYNHIDEFAEEAGEFSQFLRCVLCVGPWERFEERMKVTESLVVAAHRKIPILGLDHDEFIAIVRSNSSSLKFVENYFRLTYFMLSRGTYKEACLSFGWDHRQCDRLEMDGIQSRRLAFVSLCKLLVSDHDEHIRSDHLRLMLELLDFLEVAHRLRMTQKYSESDRDLLPTCIELAFPTPFDDANSSVYICEFAYFRDTLVYLERNKLEQYRWTCEGLSCGEIRKLDYYRNSYDEFDTCCATTTRDGIKFRCISHGHHSELEHELCPLLRRKQFFR